MRRLVRPRHRFPRYQLYYLLAAYSWLSSLLPSDHYQLGINLATHLPLCAG